MNRPNIQLMLDSLAIYPLTELLNMSYDEVAVLIAHARNELRDVELQPYFEL